MGPKIRVRVKATISVFGYKGRDYHPGDVVEIEKQHFRPDFFEKVEPTPKKKATPKPETKPEEPEEPKPEIEKPSKESKPR